jgi:tellurite resistance protein TehA-like permease
MAAAVYVLCALTSLACAILLLRAYQVRGVRLLLWSGLAFVGFTFGNVMLVMDRVVIGPQVDLSIWRSLPVLAGLAVLIYGLVWDAG